MQFLSSAFQDPVKSSLLQLLSSIVAGMVVSFVCIQLDSLVIVCALSGVPFPHSSGYYYYHHFSLSSVKFILGFDMIESCIHHSVTTQNPSLLPRPPPAVPLKSAPPPTLSPSKTLICFPSLEFCLFQNVT